MMEKTLIILLPLVYLGIFITRNLVVKARTEERIRASDPLVTASIIFTASCIFNAIVSTHSETWYGCFVPISVLRYPVVSYVGLFLFGLSIVMGWIFSSQLKQSWRIGVHKDQKTELIQTGIYAYIRNPYFLSYCIMFVGLFLVRPSVVMGILTLISLMVFHLMVLKEEAHLLNIHGKEYEMYKHIAGRYFPHFIKEKPLK